MLYGHICLELLVWLHLEEVIALYFYLHKKEQIFLTKTAKIGKERKTPSQWKISNCRCRVNVDKRRHWSCFRNVENSWSNYLRKANYQMSVILRWLLRQEHWWCVENYLNMVTAHSSSSLVLPWEHQRQYYGLLFIPITMRRTSSFQRTWEWCHWWQDTLMTFCIKQMTQLW